MEELIKSEEVDLMSVADKIQRENQQLKEQLTEKDKMVATEMGKLEGSEMDLDQVTLL